MLSFQTSYIYIIYHINKSYQIKKELEQAVTHWMTHDSESSLTLWN